jgi:hypothetical protein
MIAAPTQVVANDGEPGTLTPLGFVGSSNIGAANVVANSAFLQRVCPVTSMIYSGLAIAIFAAAGSNDNCDAGVFDQNGNLLASMGSTAGLMNGTGVKLMTFTAPIALPAGVPYYVAWGYGPIGSTAANPLGWQGSSLGGQLFGGAPPNLQYFRLPGFPLATVAAFAGRLATGIVPCLALRQ